VVSLAVEAHVECVVEAGQSLAQLLDRYPDCFSCRHHAFTGIYGRGRIAAVLAVFKSLTIFNSNRQRQPRDPASPRWSVDEIAAPRQGGRTRRRKELPVRAPKRRKTRQKRRNSLTPAMHLLCVSRFLTGDPDRHRP
jgi:hypothetical protein